MRHTYNQTRRACYWGYIVQAVIVNLAPLFFVVFQEDFGISFEKIGRLVLLTFGVQLIVDLLSVKFVDRIGYRASLILAHALAFVGLVLLGILPRVLPDPYWGLVLPVIVYSSGSGLLEVLVSPIVDALPSDAKASSMSLLHSFYSWGQVGVILVTTLLVQMTGTGVWWAYPMVWALVPLINLFRVIKAPLPPVVPEEEKTPLKALFSSRVFLVALLMMACAGASELTMSQWSSLFAEKGLGVPKVVGDLLGPCLFGVFMGVGRTAYGVLGHRLPLKKALLGSTALCLLCYGVTVFVPVPVLALLGCALCGLSVSLMWPGTISLSAGYFPRGGTTLFALLAMAGDVGGSLGPWLAGLVSDGAENASWLSRILIGAQTPEQWGLRAGLLAGMAFPLLLLAGLACLRPPKGTDGPDSQAAEQPLS